MANHEQHARRYAEQAGTDDPHFYARGTSNVFALRDRGHDTIFSYGFHFPMAKMMADGANKRGWWLVNGDRYSVTTTQHQGHVRSALAATKLPMLIVPFSALGSAWIDEDSIRLVEVLPDRYTWEPRIREREPDEYEREYQHYARNWQELDDGRWSYEAREHHLGEALFTADYKRNITRAHYDNDTGEWVSETYDKVNAYFLSAFDDNEAGFGLYFLAELPQGVHPTTVDQAREALRPEAVKRADRALIPVLRQGEVFAIPTNYTTRELTGPTRHSAPVLGRDHIATEVRTLDGKDYGRGWLRHKPVTDWGTRRRAEHRAVKLGNGKTWYQMELNTVPAGRSWSISGNVD